MIPDRDYYADKNGKLTDDPEKYASQIAVRGHYLDDRIASRYGIADMLVSTDEPGAIRRVRLGSIEKPKADEPSPEAEPEAEEPKAAADKPAKKTTTKEKK